MARRPHVSTDAAAGAVVDVAALQARIPPRAAPDGRGLRAVPTGCAAGRAAGAVADAARQGRDRAAIGAGADRGGRAWTFRGRHVVPAHRRHACAAALPRQGHHRARVARRAPAGDRRDDRAPGAAGLPRSPGHAAEPGVRARSHVHVGVLDMQLDPAAGRHHRAVDVDTPGAHPARRLRDPDGVHRHLAPGHRAQGAGAQPRRVIVGHGISSPSPRPPLRPRKSASPASVPA